MENYEEYLLLHADGELSEAEEKALDAFMTEHPEVRKELELYMAAKVQPEMGMVYEGKEQLLRKPARVAPLQWRSLAAAAAVVAIVGLGVWKWLQPNTTNITVVQVNNNTINTTAPKDTFTRKQEPAREAVAANQQAVPERKAIVPSLRPKTHHDVLKQPKTEVQRESLAGIQVASLKPMAGVTVSAAPKAIDVSVPAVQLPEAEESESNEVNSGLLARLPIKQEGIGAIANAVNSKIEKVKSIKDNFKNTDLSVRVGNKELFVVKL
jgi:HAMP domain-containing protein